MKTFYLILVSFLLLLTDSIFSQWQADVRLTNNSNSSYTSNNNAWCIATSGNILHVVWFDNRFAGNRYQICYIRSTNSGINWSAGSQLSNSDEDAVYGALAVSGSTVHVVWQDTRNGEEEIYYKRSTDGGVNWGVDTRLTNNILPSRYPSIAVSGSSVFLVWVDYRPLNAEIYFKKSTNGGLSWGSDVRLTNNGELSFSPSIAISGTTVSVAWMDSRDGNFEIYYKRSVDGGQNWLNDVRLTNHSSYSQYPSIAISGQLVHVVWSDMRVSGGSPDIYYKRSTNGGVDWGADTRLTTLNDSSKYANIVVSGQLIHIVWQDHATTNWEIFYLRSTNGGLNWLNDVQLTNNSAYSYAPSVSASGTAVHVVWCDNRDGNFEIYYKRNPTGNAVGIEKISAEVPSQFKLEQNYPNPFNPVTKIRFDIAPGSRPGVNNNAVLKIYDIMGREITTLVNEHLKPGKYEIDFNGSSYASGIYYYRLLSNNYSETMKMVLIK